MRYYNISLDAYDVDAYTMPLQVDTLNLFLSLQWPVEVQKQYDMQLGVLDQTFKSISYIDPHNMRDYVRRGFSYSLLQTWVDYIRLFDAGDFSGARGTMLETVWPVLLSNTLNMALADPTYPGLRDAIFLFVDNLKPTTDYLSELQGELVWHLTSINGQERREACIYPNVWLYQGYADYRLFFQTKQPYIGRQDLGQVTLYIALGDGDI